ncbi:MAG: MOSC domain-containing protein [Microcystaceae cyanobacterium]
MMQLLSVNVGLPKTVSYQNKTTTTGIFKVPVDHPVRLRQSNLEGDGQADLENHGGFDKAVYIYSYDYYPYWQEILQRDHLELGLFGENFTVSEMVDTQVHIGDTFKVGETIIQVTQPRIPCFKLGIRLDDPKFPPKFLKSGRTGFYVKVLQEGIVKKGDNIELLDSDTKKITVDKAVRLLYFESDNQEGIKEILSIEALSDSWRESFEKKLKEK